MENFNGAFGLAIIPDKETIECAYAFASKSAPPESQFVLDSKSIPHITVYHAKFRNLPETVVAKYLSKLRQELCEKELTLSATKVFGSKFLFWMVMSDSPNYQQLADSHRETLSLAEYLDLKQKAKAEDEEGLQLSTLERDNIAKYGHPYVAELYPPHITLVYSDNLHPLLAAPPSNHHRMKIERVEFVRVGFPGRIESFVELEM